MIVILWNRLCIFGFVLSGINLKSIEIGITETFPLTYCGFKDRSIPFFTPAHNSLILCPRKLILVLKCCSFNELSDGILSSYFPTT